jgi:multisubunit Na+/H+ antiporter MnhF subunit
MTGILDYVLWSVLGVHLLMALIAAWRTWRGENSIERLIGLDLASTLTLAVLVLVSIIQQNSIFMDVAIALAALSYLSTVVLAKFISDHKVF